MENKSKELEVAIKAALEAGKILERHLETEIFKGIKDDKSISVIADGESEEVIKKIISQDFPEHSILGEETGMTGEASDYVWHIDPVDGTRNFAHGIPFFAVVIALLYKNDLRVGVVYNPTNNFLFYAEKNKGAYLNDKRIFVSKDGPERSMMTVNRGKNALDEKLFRELLHDLPMGTVASVRDFGCTALDIAYVAQGALEGLISLGLHTYDFAASILLALEAGAKITTLDGGEWKFPDNHFIVSNGIFHDVLVQEVKKQKEKLNLD
ncbi:MAG: myo-inositol-1(or 4)-monophosphatase [Parcubacteria group bacterium Gr01-1014_24]|nr:MAG: myo-inositol-1(or 4)-monophosphatase [Parcubacteria group bacterium Gr01-1014_24]